MSDTLILNKQFVSVGLSDQTFVIPSAGLYSVHFETTEIPPSSLVVLVKKNSSTVFTAPAMANYQSAMQFNYMIQCAASDVIDVVLTSSAANDNLLNSIKSIISIEQGF